MLTRIKDLTLSVANACKNQALRTRDRWRDSWYHSATGQKVQEYWLKTQIKYYQFKDNAAIYFTNAATAVFGNVAVEVGNLVQEVMDGKQPASGKKFRFKQLRILGNLAVYVPDTEKELKDILTTGDQQPKGRIAYAPFTMFGCGESVLSATGKHGMQLHNQIAHYLLPKQELFFNHAILLLKKQLNKYPNYWVLYKGDIAKIVRETILSLVFGIDYELTEEDRRIMDDAAKKTVGNASPIALLYQFSPVFTKTQADFIALTKKILSAQVKKIQQFFNEYPNSTLKANIITDKILELIKKKHPQMADKELHAMLHKLTPETIQNYLNSCEITGMLTLIFGADFLITLIYDGLLDLYYSDGQMTFDEMQKYNLFTEDGALDYQVVAKQLQYFDDKYKRKLKDAPHGVDFLPRFFAKETKLEKAGITIPANTTVYTKFRPRGINDKDTLSMPFSTGARKCPGQRFSETLAKGIWAYVVNHFTFPQRYSDDYIEMSPRPQSSYAPQKKVTEQPSVSDFKFN